ncbi:MAG: ATP-binding protein [Candidatus Omnitrophica bacterium]|nr:ATP-binding protein [Candidatus Omnitrophota bacterium]
MDRHIEKILISRLKTWRSVALLGARQVGKSYLLQKILKTHPGTLISLDDPLERQEAARDPVRYVERYFQPGKYLFIDEAARVPEIFSAVKILVDRNDPKPTGICLANSGNYLLLRKIKESLAGRVSLLPIYPLSWQEFSHSNKVPGLIEIINNKKPKEITCSSKLTEIKRQREERIMWGGFPSPALNNDTQSRMLWIRDYLRTYVLPLVVEQFNIRDSMAFEQLSRLLTLMTAQFLNTNKLAVTSGISQPTAMNYFYYLEAMMIARRAPIFFRNPTKRLVKHPKIHICDTLLINECYGNNFSLHTALERGHIGALYESFIFNEIQKTLSNYDLFGECFTWRTQDGAEADIVLSTSKGIIPLEIKWSKRLTKKDTSGLESFMDSYRETKFGYIVYPGETIQKITKNIFAIPDWWLFGCYA